MHRPVIGYMWSVYVIVRLTLSDVGNNDLSVTVLTRERRNLSMRRPASLCSYSSDRFAPTALSRPFTWHTFSLNLYVCYYDRPWTAAVSLFLFFLAYSERSEIGCLPYFHTWCGLGANLGCRSEMCCTRLAGNTGRKKSPSGHHRTTLSSYIVATKARIDNRKKNLLNSQQYLLQMPHNMANFGPLTAEIIVS